jgi:hypothetical protein
LSERIPKRLRQEVTHRAQQRCEYCLSPLAFATEPFAVEHIVPFVLGGPTAIENLALSCSGCNGHKYNKVEALDPLGLGRVPLYHPRRDRWHDHFTWDAEYTHLIGFSPTGRATINALNLDRVGVVNLRWALFLLGLHPSEDADNN